MKQRIEWIDAAKGIGILLVMFGHNWLDWKYCFWIYAFHMPLFFILSGYTFSTKRSWSEFLFNKCKVLLVPYTVFAICNLAFYDLLSKNHAGDYAFGENALKFLLQQRHTYLWFLPTLFLSSVVTYLICRTKNCNPLVGGGYSVDYLPPNKGIRR